MEEGEKIEKKRMEKISNLMNFSFFAGENSGAEQHRRNDHWKGRQLYKTNKRRIGIVRSD